MPDETATMETMHRWLDAVCAELGLDRGVVDANTAVLLDLIRDVAHGPSRPGAPMTAFLVGLSAGQAGADPGTQSSAVAERVRRVEDLVARWPSP